MNILAEENDIIIYDPLSIDFKEFKWENGYSIHKLESQERLKFYYVSHMYYGTVEYWDILLLLNNIENIFDTPPGTEIFIPDLAELKTFILDNKK